VVIGVSGGTTAAKPTAASATSGPDTGCPSGWRPVGGSQHCQPTTAAGCPAGWRPAGASHICHRG
jgi:hypothetical protein